MFQWLTKLRQRLVAGKQRQPEKGRNTLPCDKPASKYPTRESEFVYELPFEQGARFRVLQGYGGSYSHTDESHFSIDFRMPENEPIFAARGGVVYRVVDHFSESGTHPSFKPKANAIYILHVDETIAAYVHLLKGGTFVRPGQVVNVGERIGLSGNTGWSGCPHLHFHVADAIYHERLPTVFNTAECGETIVTYNNWYTRPTSNNTRQTSIISVLGDQSESSDRDAFAFSPELLDLQNKLVGHLSEAGYELMADFLSVDVLHDVHGLEVCGIHGPDDALQITRLLLKRFPGWNAGWLHPPDSSTEQAWIASIQRNRDLVMEYWDTD